MRRSGANLHLPPLTLLASRFQNGGVFMGDKKSGDESAF
jgi:hypothetical protein